MQEGGLFKIKFKDVVDYSLHRNDFEILHVEFHSDTDTSEDFINYLFIKYENVIMDAVNEIVKGNPEFFLKFKVINQFYGDFCSRVYDKETKKTIIKCYTKKVKYQQIKKKNTDEVS